MTSAQPHIRKVAVIGSGVMGAGIAAQCANAGLDVLLLDIVPEGATDRNTLAAGAIAKLKKTKPAPLMHPRNAKCITAGNIDDDLEKIADVDWVIEVVIERLDIKRDLYRKIAKHRGKHTIVSSNTSTLPLNTLMKGMPVALQEHFLITHFFNPPRYLRLLEVVTGPKTKADVASRVRHVGDHKLGKTVIDCHDKPGFIANRIGTFWLHCAVVTALEQGIDVETADAVFGRPVGIPKTGVFGLLDLVGLDLMPHVLSSLRDALPAGDPFIKLGPPPQLLDQLIKKGYTGRKGKGGFYRLNDQRKKEALDLKTGEHYLAQRPKIAAVKAAKGEAGGLRALVTHNSPAGHYAWTVLSKTLTYAASLLGEVADDIPSIDAAMRLGYNWKLGPFELIDRLGAAWFAEALAKDGQKVPAIIKAVGYQPFYRSGKGVREVFSAEKNGYVPVALPDGVELLADIKRGRKPLYKNLSAQVWDGRDGVAILEFTSKMNSLDPFILAAMRWCVREIPKRGYKGLVIYNEGSNFSVGANIMMLLVAGKLKLSPLIDWILKDGQRTMQGLKYAPFPVVGAPAGMALGGGCEVLLHCDAITPHAESYVGLVEVGVGIIPGWGGCKELLGRAAAAPKAHQGPMPAVMHAFQTIATAHVATSADETKAAHYFHADTEVVMNRNRVLHAAKNKVLDMAVDYSPPEPFTFRLPGPSGHAALMLGLNDFRAKGLATPHDVVVGTALATTLTGGKTDVTEELSEDDVLRLERREFIKLTKTKATLDRVAHILKTGKPLRN